MKDFWRTLSFSFGGVMLAACLLQLMGLFSIPPDLAARAVLIIFAVNAAICFVCTAFDLMGASSWVQVATGFLGGTIFGYFALTSWLDVASGWRTTLACLIIAISGILVDIGISRLRASATAQEINAELDARRRMNR